MRVYRVGGSVRDELLGIPVADRDYVVVGGTPELLSARGFRPVGRDFPVFLHPETHEEYALARTERKEGHGYRGFAFYAAPDVTLEDDLRRRDLTINAMARDDNGDLIDPFNGQGDLRNRVLRHVGPAFAEDPVRILRLARFAARFGDFSVAPETAALMREMVVQGEVDHLVPERVWQEISRGLMEARPDRMILILRECGALERLMPEAAALFNVPEVTEYHPEGNSGEHLLLVLAVAARMGLSLRGRFGALVHDFGKALTPPEELPHHRGHGQRGIAPIRAFCERLRIPLDLRKTGEMAAREHILIHRLPMRPGTEQSEEMTDLLERCDAARNPERFEAVLLACEADRRGRLGAEEHAYLQGPIWLRAMSAFRGVDAGAIARACVDVAQIQERLRAARVEAVRQSLTDEKPKHRTRP